MRAAALEASVPGTVTRNARIHGVPDVAKGALSTWRDGPAKKTILERVAAVDGHEGSDPVTTLAGGVLAAYAG